MNPYQFDVMVMQNFYGDLVSALALLRHLGLDAEAGRITDATAKVLSEGRQLTRDLGGTVGTRAMADAIIARLS
jgi:isocitrate dehydrogenase (NAD+)